MLHNLVFKHRHAIFVSIACSFILTYSILLLTGNLIIIQLLFSKIHILFKLHSNFLVPFLGTRRDLVKDVTFDFHALLMC